MENKNSESYNLGAKLGRIFGAVTIACILAIMIAGTIKVIAWIF